MARGDIEVLFFSGLLGELRKPGLRRDARDFRGLRMHRDIIGPFGKYSLNAELTENMFDYADGPHL